MKTSVVRARIDVELKDQANQALKNQGLNMSMAIQLFLTKVVSTRGLPFDLKAPSVPLKDDHD